MARYKITVLNNEHEVSKAEFMKFIPLVVIMAGLSLAYFIFALIVLKDTLFSLYGIPGWATILTFFILAASLTVNGKRFAILPKKAQDLLAISVFSTLSFYMMFTGEYATALMLLLPQIYFAVNKHIFAFFKTRIY